MRAKEGVIDRLNAILTGELTSVNQYFLHASMMKNWGYERLHHKLRDLSIGEMRDTERLVDHILYLEGLPNLQRLNTLQVGESAREHLELDLAAERAMVATYAEAISHCARVEDYTTRHILEEMVKHTEEQVDWLETQLTAMDQVGVQNYLTEQLHDD